MNKPCAWRQFRASRISASYVTARRSPARFIQIPMPPRARHTTLVIPADAGNDEAVGNMSQGYRTSVLDSDFQSANQTKSKPAKILLRSNRRVTMNINGIFGKKSSGEVRIIPGQLKP